MTAVDRRSLLLEHLEEILSGLTITISTGVIPAGSIVRNRNELPAEKVPGIIMLDADEVNDPSVPPNPSGRNLAVGPRMMRMTPEIYVVLDVRKPANKNVGPDLNAARQQILKAVLFDKTLQQIVGANGNVGYDGCVTDLARNRTMQGQMGISITFTYPFIPGELAL